MASKQLQAEIVLGGRTTSGFNGLSNKIQQLGTVVDQIGGKIREWESDSVETYKNYETYMLEAKGAMSANYESASQLEKAYAGLQQKAQEWAASSIFHTNDVAKAISEAAHAGWEYDEMLQGIPRAMLLAQAGNIDLSSGLDMLIKTINGTGIAFEDSGQFVDQWVMAANSSATTVSELGEAMERMGTTARFGDSTGELLTMLAVLADTGTVGAQAGTLLRNSMIRLIAPTKTARESMEQLGLSADEISEAVGGDSETLQEVNELLTGAGFSAYTSTGELKPFLTTFKELYAVTQGMTEENRNKVLSNIFPTRTITGALALLEAAANNYDGLLEKITNSEGYAADVAETQTSGLMGAEELFLSKWEEFSRKVGETLSDPLKKVYDFAGKIVDRLNGMDETTLSALVGGLTTIAELGPALMIGALAVKSISTLGVGGTAFVLAAAGAGALYGYLSKMNELALENNFGTMSLDMEEISAAIGANSNDIAAAQADLTEFQTYLTGLQETYTKTGELLAEGLTSKMVAGTTLTKEDKEKFKKYGEDMIAALKEGLVVEEGEKIEFANLIFKTSSTGEEGGDVTSDPLYASIIGLIDAGMTSATEEAEKLSGELRSALTSAFADGKLTEEEMKNIQSIIDQMNELMDGLNPSDVNRTKLDIKSQRVSLDSMKEFTEEVQQERAAAFASMDEEMLDMQAQLMVYYEWAKKHGQKIKDPSSGEYVDAESVDINQLIASLQKKYDLTKTEWSLGYDQILQRGWDYALSTSDTGSLFTGAQGILEFAQKGLITFAEAEERIAALGGDGDLLGRSMDQMIEFYGGLDKMAEQAANYRELGGAGNLAMADWLEEMIYLREALGGARVTRGAGDTPERAGNLEMMAELGEIYQNGATEEGVMAYYEALTDVQKKAWDDNIAELRAKYNLADLANEYVDNTGGMSDQLLDWLGAYILSKGLTQVPDEYEWGEYSEDALLKLGQERKESQLQAEIDDAQESLDQMKERSAEIAATLEDMQIFGDDDGATKEYLEEIEALSEEKIELDADIEAAEEKVSGLQQKLDEMKQGQETDPTRLRMDNWQALEDIRVVNEKLTELSEITPLVTLKLDSRTVDTWKKDDTFSKHTVELEDGTLAWTPPGNTSSIHTVFIQTVGEMPDGSGGGGGGGGINNGPSSVPVAAFAEGGRATTASIFGEDGAEWAIPEEHTLRTAELLNAAREASGFTWGELIAARGGLNAGIEGEGINVNIGGYSPVINAGDAQGVAAALAEDKERLTEVIRRAVRKAMDEMSLMRGIAAYA